jgi:hypothetical protein
MKHAALAQIGFPGFLGIQAPVEATEGKRTFREVQPAIRVGWRSAALKAPL